MHNKVLLIDILKNQEYQPLLTGMPQTQGMRSGRVFLQPGQECGRHSTNAHEEILVFLTGNGTAYVGPDSKPYPVGAGKIIYIPPFTEHNIKNTTTEPFSYIYCVAPVCHSQDPMEQEDD